MPRIKSTNLQVSTPIEGSAPDAELSIENDPAKPVRVGTYVFQLRVSDDAGNVSDPTTHKIVVLDDTKPTAVIDGPNRVPVGSSFTLSGDRSHDPQGRIVKYSWTLIQAP
jgi:hypothetical protein